MGCEKNPREKAFRIAMIVLVIAMLVYAFKSGNYSVGALSVIPVLLFVYSECGSLPFLTCDPEDEIPEEFSL
ncbi:hypothetical protein [Thermococcus sp. GR6]|uniref:hypothetical protein n=1 Tax=Thermococcus sp. GR6 TaxID=1638256 RepID=UPI0014301689|nr:hypothetical protein [Thermococcus sp. GR6]NJE43364.1 hypothetical protein [Thermococcus sp. GR6]